MSTSAHISKIMQRNLSSKAKVPDPDNIKFKNQTKGADAAATRDDDEKVYAKMRKRLHHEFQSFLQSERDLCRSSHGLANQNVLSILTSGLDQQSKPKNNKEVYLEDWEYLQQYGESHKRLTANSSNIKVESLARTAQPVAPKTARAKATKKLLSKVAPGSEVADFQLPLSRRSLASLSSSQAGQKTKNNSKLGKGVAPEAMEAAALRPVEAGANLQVSHHSTGSTSPSMISKQTASSANRPQRAALAIKNASIQRPVLPSGPK